ncbi:MAG: 23S rRNA accumulation protein YceD [Enterobacteriaceae bacterium]
MQQVKLPLTIDITRSAQKRDSFEGGYAREQLTRLAESVVSVNSDINAQLSCYLDEQGLAVVEGWAETEVSLSCQRCDKPFTWPVHVEFCVSPIRNPEQADALPEHYDSVEVDPFGKSDLLGLIEDEIILSLPIVPRHQIEHCEVSDTERVFGTLPETEQKPNPFTVLASLKQKHKS